MIHVSMLKLSCGRINLIKAFEFIIRLSLCCVHKQWTLSNCRCGGCRRELQRAGSEIWTIIQCHHFENKKLSPYTIEITICFNKASQA